jgi:ABC-type transporter Mla MlaB component
MTTVAITQGLTSGNLLAVRHVAASPPVPMLKIQRVVDSTAVTLIVVGRIDAEQLPTLQSLVQAEHVRDIVLDLTDVRLVDAAVVRFLVQCETQGVRFEHCPAYIRAWMTREAAS